MSVVRARVERVRSPRLPLAIPVAVAGPFPTVVTQSINLSDGGMCLRPPPAITVVPGMTLTASFRLSNAEHALRLPATVMWSDANQGGVPLFGIRFDSTDGAPMIRAFMASYRYRVVMLEFPDAALARRALADRFVVHELGTEAELFDQLATRQVGLVLLGEGVDRLARIIGATDDIQPPIVYCANAASVRLDTAIASSRRVVYHRATFDALELETLASRLVNENAVAIENERMTGELERALDRLRLENALLRTRTPAQPRIEGLVGESQPIRRVLELVERVAPVQTTVLIVGETGTGKDLVARAIHAQGQRAARPFVPVNCAAISETLLESELFGHTRGAFTGAHTDRIGLIEAADGGTIFLDEVGEMPPAMQAKLLRALQSGEVRRIGATRTVRLDVRLICATNRDLATMVRDGQFRDDLYYRLRGFVIQVPPLRDRVGDLALLVHHFLDQLATRHGRRAPTVTADAMRLFHEHAWPGNVRELAHTLESLLVVCPDDCAIDAALLRESLALPQTAAPRTLDRMLEDYERHLIAEELARANGVIAHAAATLGIDRTTLSRRCQRLGLATKLHAKPL